METLRKSRRIVIAAALVMLALAGGVLTEVLAAGGGAHNAPSPVLVDTKGLCPKDPTQVMLNSDICRRTKFGNAVSAIFQIPKGQWGVAYAFRCTKPDDFYTVVHLPGFDGIIPLTGVFKHARQGRGYRMETNDWQAGYSTVPAMWQNPQDMVVDSTCSWHVRVIAGPGYVVSRYIPALP